MRISVEPLTSIEDSFAIGRASWLHDTPDIPYYPRSEAEFRFANSFPGFTNERYLARIDDVPVGMIDLQLPQHDNLDSINVDLAVLPEHRRRGAGRALFEKAVSRARALGRKHLIGPSVETRPDGGAFASAVGAKPGLAELRSRLDLGALDEPALSRMLADAWSHADGYRLVLWTGAPPDEIIDDVAYLEGRLNADAPVGDLAWEPERMDADRIRQADVYRTAAGRVSHHAGAMHGDRLVAWTAIAGSRHTPEHVWQQITLVDPDHRGHRLGMLVKLANLGQVRERCPGLAAIDTFNAASNEHMLRINRAMGFRPVDSWMEWQATL